MYVRNVKQSKIGIKIMNIKNVLFIALASINVAAIASSSSSSSSQSAQHSSSSKQRTGVMYSSGSRYVTYDGDSRKHPGNRKQLKTLAKHGMIGNYQSESKSKNGILTLTATYPVTLPSNFDPSSSHLASSDSSESSDDEIVTLREFNGKLRSLTKKYHAPKSKNKDKPQDSATEDSTKKGTITFVSKSYMTFDNDTHGTKYPATITNVANIAGNTRINPQQAKPTSTSKEEEEDGVLTQAVTEPFTLRNIYRAKAFSTQASPTDLRVAKSTEGSFAGSLQSSDDESSDDDEDERFEKSTHELKQTVDKVSKAISNITQPRSHYGLTFCLGVGTGIMSLLGLAKYNTYKASLVKPK